MELVDDLGLSILLNGLCAFPDSAAFVFVVSDFFSEFLFLESCTKSFCESFLPSSVVCGLLTGRLRATIAFTLC